MTVFSTLLRQIINGLQSGSIYALVALGYSKSDAMHAIRGVEGVETMEVEDIVRQSLAYLI